MAWNYPLCPQQAPTRICAATHLQFLFYSVLWLIAHSLLRTQDGSPSSSHFGPPSVLYLFHISHLPNSKKIYVCLECIDVCVCVCACMHPERPEEVGRCLPYHSPFIPLRQGLSMNLGACIFSVRLGASKPQQSFCFYHPLEMGSQGCLTYYAGAGVWNLVLMIAEPVLTATESSLYLCTLLTPIMLL